MANQVYSLVLSYTAGGQFAQNVLHWQFDDAGFGTRKEAAEALQIAWNASRKSVLMGILPNVVTLNSLKGRCVSAVGGFEAFSPMTSGNVGTRSGAISVTGVSPVIIHYPTNIAFGRGRTFLPGVRETDVDGGVYTSTYRGDVETALATLFDNLTLTGGGGPTAIFGIWKTPGNVFHTVAKVILSENVGTQRRRMRPA